MTDLTFEQISAYFHLPINEASKELKICATILKKVCRANGITRWPHRKIRSLENMIQQLKLQQQTVTSEAELQKIQSEIADFEEKKHFLMKNPNISYKTIVPKSTLQTFSKSKSKSASSSSSSSSQPAHHHVYHHHHYETKSSLKEQVLEALSKLSEVEPSLPSTNPSKDIPPHVDSKYYLSSILNADNEGDHTSSSSSSAAHPPPPPRKFNLPLKKEILKIEREKEEKLKSLASLCSSALHEDEEEEEEVQTSTSTSTSPPSSFPSTPTIQIISFDEYQKSIFPKKRKFDCLEEDERRENDENDDVHTRVSTSDSTNHNDSSSEFEQFKASFPSIKYVRLFESQPFYFIAS